jgi:CsoR family transcriptional regulator, copper-sensing transcriptional repressor
MPITDESKEKLKNRLAKAMGHLNAVHRMVDEKKYCIDVLHQLKAVQSALDKVSEEILKQHLETCMVDAVQNQDAERVIEELIQVFRRAPELNLEEFRQKQWPGNGTNHTPKPSEEPVPNGRGGCCH